MTFREFTPAELADELYRVGEGLESVELELQAPDGTVIHYDVVQLSVGFGEDLDRSGGYRWVKITGRIEPSQGQS